MKNKLTQQTTLLYLLSVLLLLNKFDAIAQCTPSTAQVNLDINNVRAKLINGGDMWWDLTNAGYEVPKNSGKYSIYAGGLWIGGLDTASNLHLAAQTYRQTGNDFWAGPVAPTGMLQSNVCSDFDQMWKINKQDVLDFMSGSSATPAMISFPGNFNGQNLAPYFDANNDNVYNTAQGDYPYFDTTGQYVNGWNNYLHGDQSVWWVFNDVGNTHTETGGAQLGIEVRAEAFAYSMPGSPIDNTTFYQYTLINQSNSPIYQMYFGQWVDPDLGWYNDDFVGCDVMRNMGYCYNGDSVDEGLAGYGTNPPAVGIKILQGPLADPGDGIDNNHNGVIDEPGEQILLSKFVYYDNAVGPHGNPNGANHYYNYLKGIWGDGQVITHGQQGYNPANTPCDYMYPDTTDYFTDNWNEVTAGNTPGDRRFLMSCGPFTMQPGAVQNITLAVVWAQDSSNTGGVGPSIGALQQAADSVQAFFSLLNGSTGIAEHQQTISSTVYPNPFSESTTISINNPSKEKLSCKIFDARGMMVRSFENISTNKIIVNRNQLSSGLYFYKLESNSQKVSAGKFVVE